MNDSKIVDEYNWMIGKVFRTPFEPWGLVKVLRVHDGYYAPTIPKRTVQVEFIEDHPHGYPAGQLGCYFADDLKLVEGRSD